MQNAKNFRVMFSSIQNAKFIALVMAFFEALLTFFFWPLEAKIQNRE